MTAVGQHLGPLLVSEEIGPDGLSDAVAHAVHRLHVGAAQVDVDLVVLAAGDDARV